jgi:hypothetical protein
MYHSVLAGDSSRPAALQRMLERLGFTNSAARITQRVFNELPDALADWGSISCQYE